VRLSNPQSWNRYAYVQRDPVNHNDPSGLTTCDENGDNCYDSVTVNGDTGEVDWSDIWPSVDDGGYYLRKWGRTTILTRSTSQ
jgi:hypothetical protein